MFFGVVMGPIAAMSLLGGVGFVSQGDSYGLGWIAIGAALLVMWGLSFRQEVWVDPATVTVKHWLLTTKIDRSAVLEWSLRPGLVGVLPRRVLYGLDSSGKVIDLGKKGVWAPKRGRQAELCALVVELDRPSSGVGGRAAPALEAGMSSRVFVNSEAIKRWFLVLVVLAMPTALLGGVLVRLDHTTGGAGLLALGVALTLAARVGMRQGVWVSDAAVVVVSFARRLRIDRAEVIGWAVEPLRDGASPRLVLRAHTRSGAVIDLGARGVSAPVEGPQRDQLQHLAAVLSGRLQVPPPAFA